MFTAYESSIYLFTVWHKGARTNIPSTTLLSFFLQICPYMCHPSFCLTHSSSSHPLHVFFFWGGDGITFTPLLKSPPAIHTVIYVLTTPLVPLVVPLTHWLYIGAHSTSTHMPCSFSQHTSVTFIQRSLVSLVSPLPAGLPSATRNSRLFFLPVTHRLPTSTHQIYCICFSSHTSVSYTYTSDS